MPIDLVIDEREGSGKDGDSNNINCDNDDEMFFFPFSDATK